MNTPASSISFQIKQRTIFILLCATVFFLCSPLLLKGQLNVYAAVVINEILPKPSDPANQWIELYNTGTDTVSLNQWKIENTSNGGKSYIIAASGSISGHGFYLINRSQSAIPLSIEGDTVKLSDPNNTAVDTQSYPGTLGFNTSMGRMPDGTGLWTICAPTAPDGPYAFTPNLPNNCPIPTPSPTPTVTPVPTSTPIPTDTPTDAPTPTAMRTFAPITFGNVLGTTNSLTPTLTPSPTPGDVLKIVIPNAIVVPKTLAIQIGIIVAAWILIAVTATIRGRRKRQKRAIPPVS
ncbi:MAG TPA: lamin tail domain-containing protein [Patescibacteria group bacterium]|nr:lamin tail domain-containing protein [Patescibacteria group bacterium]